LCLVVKLLGPTKTHSKDPLSFVRFSETNFPRDPIDFVGGFVWFYGRIHSTKVMSNASDDDDDLDSLIRARPSSAFLIIKSGFISCMILMTWISSFQLLFFGEGYQHLGLIPLRDHIVWFCVGVNGGPAKGVGCIQEFIAAYTYLCE
jgi:hypothetical protein